MTGSLEHVILDIHAAQRPGVFAVTGGGTAAIAAMLGIPGASRTVLEVVVPYAEASFVRWLGERPASFCDLDTAVKMAARAFADAQSLAPALSVFGLGCTASLATDRPKRGDHRAHVAMQSHDAIRTVSLTFTKGARTRQEEEAVLTAMIVNLLAEAVGIPDLVAVSLVPGEMLEQSLTLASDPIQQLLRGEIATVIQHLDGRLEAQPVGPHAFLSGSFNPLHAGHRRLVEVAERVLGLPVGYELSIRNADKPSLDPVAILQRLPAFRWHRPIWLSREPFFVDKAILYPNSVMIIGIDTAVRLLDAKYTDHEVSKRDATLSRIAATGCTFLVAGRTDAMGQFQAADSIDVPMAFRGLFRFLSEAEFRLDLSSTQLRMR